MAKVINGHIYECFYMGIVTYVIDGEQCWDIETAAKLLGITVEEFNEAK